MADFQLINAQSAEVLVADLKLAATFWSRLRGLQFRKKLPDGEGLLIVPCRSIHTHWMRFPIDVAMINEHGVVVKIQQKIAPWRTCAGPRGTKAVLEVSAKSALLKEGDKVAIRMSGQDEVPFPARFLSES